MQWCTAAIMTSKQEGLAVSELAMINSYSEADTSTAPSEMVFEIDPPPLSSQSPVSKSEIDTYESTSLLANPLEPLPVVGLNYSSGSDSHSGSDTEPLLNSSGAHASDPHACDPCTASVSVPTIDKTAVPSSEKSADIDLESDEGSEATCRICLEAGGTYLPPYLCEWSVNVNRTVYAGRK